MSQNLCPICGNTVDWVQMPPYRIGDDGQYEPLVRGERDSEASWRDRLGTAHRPCGDPGRQGTHWLPYDYPDHTPVTIGLVGDSGAGKTHLLAAMIHRLCSNDPVLGRLGLRVGPLDLRLHQRYMGSVVRPLIHDRRRLMGTPADRPVAFCAALGVTNAHGRRFALTFFDLAGERLTRPDDDEVRFYATAHAMIFVVDAEALPGRFTPPATGDAAFDVALRRLEARRNAWPRPRDVADLNPIAAAVVVAKADLVRFEDRLVSDWLALGSSEEEIQLSTVEQESRDVYAYLTRRRATPWLRPAQECARSTLHFASATNGPARDNAYHGAFRQLRVLKPLLSVFAMTGILDEQLLRPAEEAS